jgi:hypothetical protein
LYLEQLTRFWAKTARAMLAPGLIRTSEEAHIDMRLSYFLSKKHP